ncbi:hypothetical protein [Methylobacter svalbardensis]|uniref:hypothetical protein n=1 Tax=Methylobacter svalbardensis TaxID=3080016 RepID=UPI0030EF28DB
MTTLKSAFRLYSGDGNGVGRLPVDLVWKRHGLGKLLLRDAILLTIQASGIVGIKALLVHALSGLARRMG